jgi:hypothetical protein
MKTDFLHKQNLSGKPNVATTSEVEHAMPTIGSLSENQAISIPGKRTKHKGRIPPGPISLPFIGTIYKYLPYGNYYA